VALLVNDDRLTTRVGAAVLVITALAVLFVLTIYGRLEKDGTQIKVYFAQVTAVSEGASVQIAGNTIGSLTSIVLVRGSDVPVGHPLHGVGGIAATANLDPAWAARIPRNADFFISARSMFAPKYLEIGPPQHKALPDRFLVEGDEIRGIDPPSLDQVLQRTWESLNDTKRFMDAIRPSSQALTAAIARLTVTVVTLEPAPGTWTAVDTEMRGAYAEATQLVDEARQGKLDVARLSQLAARTRALAGKVDGVVSEMRTNIALLKIGIARIQVSVTAKADLKARIEQAIADAERALAGADQLLAGIRGIGDDITSRRGTVGAMMGDLELIDDMKELTKVLKRHPWQVMTKPQ
jgi:ABC-type transporter Mla subunit MlaD